MENQRRIDCHTHIVNQKIKDAYYQNPGGYAIIMEFLPQFANAQMPDESWQIAAADERLFYPLVSIFTRKFCPSCRQSKKRCWRGRSARW